VCGTISQPPKAMWPLIEKDLHVDFYYNINKDAFHVPSHAIAGRDKVMVIAQSKLPENPGTLCAQVNWGVRIREQFIYNARIETAHSKITWAEGFQFHRYLVPVMSFFEMDQRARRQYECYRYNDEVFMLGGIGISVPGSENRHLIICTQEPTPEVAAHHKRQPVIVPPHMYDEWLTNNYDPISIIGRVTQQSFPVQLREAA
jgi:putative SOS response-associated peptidase YedK